MKKILCLHGAGDYKENFDVLTKQLQKKLEGKYEFIFINGPVARTPINTCTEEPITYDWFVRKKDAANFFDSIMFDLDLLLPYINQYWDQDFVGLWGFSMGAHTSTLIARHLAPLPEFVWLMGLSPIPPSAKLSGYDPMIDHLSGFRVLSLMGDADNGKDVFINYKKSYETMWYKGAHDYCSDPDAYDRLCAWLEPVPNYDYTIDSYNIEIINKKETNQIILDSNERITATRATIGTDIANITNGEQLVLDFPKSFPAGTHSVLLLELNGVTGSGLDIPCLKRQKVWFTLKSFSSTVNFQFLVECTQAITVVDGIEYTTNTYKTQSMELGLFKVQAK